MLLYILEADDLNDVMLKEKRVCIIRCTIYNLNACISTWSYMHSFCLVLAIIYEALIAITHMMHLFIHPLVHHFFSPCISIWSCALYPYNNTSFDCSFFSDHPV